MFNLIYPTEIPFTYYKYSFVHICKPETFL